MSTEQEKIELAFSEAMPRRDLPWSAGDVLEIGDINDFRAFEQELPQYIDGHSDPVAWSSRPDIGDHLRPKKFFGKISDIRLVPIPDPVETIRKAQAEGPTVLNTQGKGSHGIIFRDANPQIIDRCLGFDFTGVAKSTGKGSVGTIKTTLVYAPPLIQIGGSKNGEIQVTRKSTLTPYGLRRYLLKPVMETETPWQELLSQSVERATRHHRYNLGHVILNPSMG